MHRREDLVKFSKDEQSQKLFGETSLQLFYVACWICHTESSQCLASSGDNVWGQLFTHFSLLHVNTLAMILIGISCHWITDYTGYDYIHRSGKPCLGMALFPRQEILVVENRQTEPQNKHQLSLLLTEYDLGYYQVDVRKESTQVYFQTYSCSSHHFYSFC